MLDVHWSELIFIAVMALLVLGPADFVKAMRTAGHWVRDIKLAFYKMRSVMDAASFEADALEVDALKSNDKTPLEKDDSAIEDTHEVTCESEAQFNEQIQTTEAEKPNPSTR